MLPGLYFLSAKWENIYIEQHAVFIFNNLMGLYLALLLTYPVLYYLFYCVALIAILYVNGEDAALGHIIVRCSYLSEGTWWSTVFYFGN